MRDAFIESSGLRLFALAATTAALGLAGCEGCEGGGTQVVQPNIVVEPTEIVFDKVPAAEEASQLVTIRNDGTKELLIDGDPELQENSEDAETEFVLRGVMEPVDCSSGAARADDDPYSLEPGECATVTVGYVPINIGVDTGALIIRSNDPDTPELTVPINAEGSAPDIEVCVLASDCSAETVCNDMDTLSMHFPVTAINASTTCPVRITNTGALPLKRLAWDFKSGNRRRDYLLDPEDLGSLGDLGEGEGVEVNVTFQPKSGGLQEALLEIVSSDPDEGAVTIHLEGMGDGPKVCPDPFPQVDFGTVAVGATEPREVTLENCGTLPLDITKLEVQDNSGGPSNVFAMGAGAPGTPISLNPGETATVPVEFTPTTPGLFNGRLYLESTDPVVPSGWVNLVGQGEIPPSCQIQTSTTTLHFGTAAPGYPVEKTLVVSNPGQLDCTGVTAEITAGANVAFNVVGLPAGGPPWTLTPGQIVTFTLQYDPQDTTGPDQGTFTIGAAELSMPVEVALLGDPVANPSCNLDITPRPGNFTLSACAFGAGLNPRVAQFGATKIGREKTLTVSLENQGSIPCNVTQVEMVEAIPLMGIDPTFTLATGQNRVSVNGSLTNTINPGEIGVIEVRYKPTSEAENCGRVIVQTDDTTHLDGTECAFNGGMPGCAGVTMIGQGVRSAIEVIPTEVDFGVVTVGCASRDTDVTIYNIGQAPLNVTDIYLDPPGKGQPPSGPFSITAAPPLPTTIAGGSSMTIKLKYRPPDTNTHSALLVIESDAQNGNYFTTPLTGQGTNDSHQVDQFQQLSEPMVDVLWVVDDSCSMSEEQNNIANNANTFLNRALNLMTDFQLGVVTTDMTDPNKSGRLQSRNGRPKIITRSTPNPAAAFADNVRQGTFGDATEKGLDATHAALSDPLINDPAANAGFLRDDAKLVVIAVSDEEDSSTPPVDFFVDFLKNIKGYRNSDLMSFSAIVGPEPSGCSSADGDAVAGTRYLEVARRTGGLERSICSNNWGQIADDLGLDAFGAKSQFFLSREPIPSSIVVRVNGSTVPSSDYSYDAPSQSVIFDPTAVPPQGATVEVEYDTVCN
ncbi:MAG: choice-of-anchor D domain-containing protein [Deltaproteobacteria bacterium]|nr:MAG: choice-of-anchor D domain-containing protein [Deltaproteobacteria bacterium]